MRAPQTKKKELVCLIHYLAPRVSDAADAYIMDPDGYDELRTRAPPELG